MASGSRLPETAFSISRRLLRASTRTALTDESVSPSIQHADRVRKLRLVVSDPMVGLIW